MADITPMALVADRSDVEWILNCVEAARSAAGRLVESFAAGDWRAVVVTAGALRSTMAMVVQNVAKLEGAAIVQAVRTEEPGAPGWKLGLAPELARAIEDRKKNGKGKA